MSSKDFQQILSMYRNKERVFINSLFHHYDIAPKFDSSLVILQKKYYICYFKINDIMRKSIFLIIATLFFSACTSKKVSIDIENLNELGEVCDTSFFHGINDSFSDFYYDDLCRVVGEPNEYDYDDYDDYKGDSKNPIYYFNDGKVLIHWSGDEVDPMGTMVFTPFDNKPRYIEDCIFRASEYGINDKTEVVYISLKKGQKQIKQPAGFILRFEFKKRKLVNIWHD